MANNSNNQKKYASLATLQNFLNNLKNLFATKTDVNTELAKKADSSHTHTIANVTNLQTTLDSKATQTALNSHINNADVHFTATERTKLSGIAAGAQVNTVTGVKGGSESAYRTGNINITKANIGLGNVDNTADANKSVKHATSADSATSATKATQDGNGKVISSTYETKTDAASKLTEAKTYADNAANTVKNDLLNNAGAAYDTLKELGDLIDDNKDAIDALNDVAAGKANAVHTHAISDVSGLQSALDGKANSSHGTHVSYSTTAPVMDGTASVGTATTVARSDHVHPTDTSRASKTEFDSHNSDTTKHITSTERTNWNAAKTHADSAHAPSNAQPNQNAFSNIKVGTTTIAADTTTDTLTLAGTNVTITPDATNDKVTISVANGTTSAKGVVQLTDSVTSTSTTTAATPKNVKAAYDLANTAKSTADGKADKTHTHKVADITDLTATATELNYMDGVTSNVQLQLDEMADSLSDKLSSDDFARNITSSANTVGQFAKVAYGAGKFVAIPYTYASDTSKFAYSSDGEIWAFVNAPSTSVQASWKDIIYADGKFVVIGNANGTTSANYSAVSTDGINWTVGNFPTGGTPYSIAYGNGRFVVVGSNTVSAHSADGLNWTRELLPSSCQAMIVAFGNGKFVAPNPNGYVCAYSTDGSSWTMGDIIASEFSRITFNNGRFVSVGNKSIQYSDDGINWTSVTPPMSANWYALTSGEGYFVALGYRKADFIYSADGITWKTATAPVTDYWCDIEYGGGKFIVTTEGGTNFLTISFTKNEFGLAYESDIENLKNSFPDVYSKADQKWSLIYDSGEISAIANSISNIDISGYTNIQVLVRCYNDGDSVNSRAGSAIFTCANGKTYQFPVWSNMFSKSINTVYTMATFNLVDGWLVCPCASRFIGDANTFEDEGGTASSLSPVGSGMMKCTSKLSKLTISNLDQNSNYYFGMGSRVMVWGWNG